MTNQCLSFVISGNEVIGVNFDISNDTPKLIESFSWPLQKDSSRVEGYKRIFERVKDYVLSKSISTVYYKGSAVGQARPTLAHLLSAELRGVVATAAVCGGASVEEISKAVVSKKFGTRKADEYIRPVATV